MLILTRKCNEEILVGDNIKVTVLRVRGQTVRIGIDAPDDVRIVRSELKMKDDDATEPAEEETSPADERLTITPVSRAREAARSGSQRPAGKRSSGASTLRMLAARRREAALTRSIAQTRSCAEVADGESHK